MPTHKLHPAPERPRRLYRSEGNKVIAGVAGGLGDYFDVDPTIVRVIFILMGIWGGSGILIYLLLWVLIPSESQQDVDGHIEKNVGEMKSKAEEMAGELRSSANRKETRMWWGWIVVGLGLFFLFTNYGLIRPIDFGQLWPVLLIAFGLIILIRR